MGLNQFGLCRYIDKILTVYTEPCMDEIFDNLRITTINFAMP